MIIDRLCPDSSAWHIVLISLRPEKIIIHLEPLTRTVRCPICGQASSRIHSRYRRHPWDLPWCRWPVQLWITCRRFFCDKPNCPRRIFSEPFPEILQRYARQTDRLRLVLLEMAHAGSAEGAARVAAMMGFLTSGDSLLRHQRRETITVSEPRAIGVDEFAFRRGPVYGTIIVDLERHRPIEVLDSDQAEPFSNWLKAHPTVEVITRDRDESYAMAGRAAAPGAMQVADRFHLVRNVWEAMKMVCQSRKWKLTAGKEITQIQDKSVQTTDTGSPPVAAPVPNPQKLARWQAVRGKKSSRLLPESDCKRTGHGPSHGKPVSLPGKSTGIQPSPAYHTDEPIPRLPAAEVGRRMS